MPLAGSLIDTALHQDADVGILVLIWVETNTLNKLNNINLNQNKK